jgi:hypothetical protein
VSRYRQQALIEASPDAIWELVGNPARHTEWWPRVVNVQCEGLEEGCEYRQVTRMPGGESETTLHIERLDVGREVLIRCVDTGTYTRWLLTEAQGDTFVEAEFGMDPKTVGTRVFDWVAGKRYFRKWLEQSIDALKQAARARAPTGPPAPG